jgi:hypothetical protein
MAGGVLSGPDSIPVEIVGIRLRPGILHHHL